MDGGHLIVTGRNGALDGTKPDHVVAMVRDAVAEGHIVVHFHGGLVSEAAGLHTAGRLREVYSDAGTYPIFMIWQSGLVETLKHNLDEIFTEDLFRSLLKRVLQFAVGKVWQEEGQRAARVVPTPKTMDVEDELKKRTVGKEPYADETALATVTEVAPEEQDQLVRVLQADPDLRAAVEQVVAQRHPETTDTGARGVVVRREASAASLIDPDALNEIDPGAGAAGERGVISTLAAAKKAAAVLVRVIGRFRDHDDHGLYPTVVEELLREFYLANAGGAVWAAMKKETLDTFGAPERGGRLLLDEMARALEESATRPEITLVGHSAGAVYIDNLLAEVMRGTAEGDRAWPDDVRFRVILLAPAATYPSFGTALTTARDLIRECHVFTMTDAAECADHLLGPVYPRSLLYLVSGVVERDDHGASAVVPVIGMNRYRGAVYAERQGLTVGREFLSDDRVVLSPSPPDAPPGRRAGALSHGAFDDDQLVRDSIAHLLSVKP